MQQQILFLKAEIAKFQSEIARLQQKDDAALVKSLEQENATLRSDIGSLSREHSTLKEQLTVYEKDMRLQKERIKELEDQLQEAEVAMRNLNEATPYSLVDATNLQQQMTTIYELLQEMTNKNHATFAAYMSESQHLQRYLLKEITAKNKLINELLMELATLKNPPNETTEEMLANLDAQIKKLLLQTMHVERQLEDKINLLNELETNFNEKD